MRERQLGSRYVLTELLGRGAMGQVYRARVQPGPGADVAIKVIGEDRAGDHDLVRRFLEESRLLRSVDHPNVVRIHDLVAEGDQVGIVMDLVPDGDLRRAVPMPCPEREAARIVAELTAGLAAVHAAGIVHRDLKPENVLVERLPDGTVRARVSDFGVSRFETAAGTRTHGMTGTVGYIAPEIARGESATAAGDLYALGVILYELCTGHGPFRAENTIALIRAHAEDAVPRPAGMSDPMWHLVGSLLAKDPADRPSADQVAAQLHQLDPSLPSGQDTVPMAADAVPPLSAPGTVESGTVESGTVESGLPGEAVTLPGSILPDSILPGPIAPSPIAAAPIAPVPVPVASVPLPPAPVPPGSGRRRDVPGRPWVYVVIAAAVVVAVAGIMTWSLRGSTPLTAQPAAPAGPAGSDPAESTTIGPTTGPAAGVASATATTVTATYGSAASRTPAILPPTAVAPARTEVSKVTVSKVAVSRVTVTAARPAVTATPVTPAIPATRTAVTSVTQIVTAAPAGASTAATAPADPRQGTVPLYRYLSSVSGDHFYTTDYSELGAGRSGYKLERIQGYLYPAPRSGTVPFYRYLSSVSGDHFYTTKYSELGAGKSGYKLERIQGYVYPSPTTGTSPLYRYFDATNGDHFYTTNYDELGAGKGKYVYEGICAYLR